MTELEQQLTNALTALSKQYEAEMEQQAEWVGELQEQVRRLEESVKDLKPPLVRTEASAKDLKQQVEILAANYKEIAEVLREGAVLTSIRGLRQDIRQDMARKKSRMGPLVKAECADVAGAMTATGSLSAAYSP